MKNTSTTSFGWQGTEGEFERKWQHMDNIHMCMYLGRCVHLAAM